MLLTQGQVGDDSILTLTVTTGLRLANVWCICLFWVISGCILWTCLMESLRPTQWLYVAQRHESIKITLIFFFFFKGHGRRGSPDLDVTRLLFISCVFYLACDDLPVIK